LSGSNPWTAGTITGSFEFTAVHEMDLAKRVTATGAFNQVPLVKK
jgi:hypothetical protein